ncbi:MAG: phage tail-like protein [Myxococcota bacterium]|jgi:phage tail-like protein
MEHTMYPKNDISWDLDKYLGSFNFRISINSIAQEKMKVVSINNIVSESDIVEYMLGPEPYVRKIPGKAKFAEIEITRIYQGYDSFYDWRTKIEDGIDDLRDVTVEILAPDLETTVRKMTLINCWPHRWQLPNLDASSTAPAIETIVLACERVTQALSSAMSPQTSSAGADANAGNGAGPISAGNALGLAHEDPVSDNSFWDQLAEEFDRSVAIHAEAGGLFDPNEETWDPPEAVEDPTAEKNGGDGTGPKFAGNATGEAQEFGDTGGGTGPKSGRGAQDEAEYGEEGETLDPNEETWDEADGAEDPTAEKNGGDGTGTKFAGNATGESQEFADTTGDDGVPLDPNEESWDAPTAVDDPTAERNGSDGTGPLGGRGAQAEFDSGEGDGPIGGRGAQAEFDSGEGDGPITNEAVDFGGSAAAEDPTAAQNGGDGTGPLGGRDAQVAADGAGAGPITNDAVDYGGSAAAEDPTAADNGGDGSGPIGGRGAQAAADSGAGAGPITNDAVDYGGSAAAEDPTAAKNGGDGSGPIGGRGEGGGGQTE